MVKPTDPPRPGAYQEIERTPTGRRMTVPGSNLARELDAATADLLAVALAEAERRFNLRLETHHAAQQSAELTMAIKGKNDAEKSAQHAQRRATVRGALAIGSSTTTLIVLAIVGAVYKAVAGMYADAVEAVTLHGERTEVIEARSDEHARAIEALGQTQVQQGRSMTEIDRKVDDVLLGLDSIAQQLEPKPRRKTK